MRSIESKLDMICEEIRSLRRHLDQESFKADLNRRFWVLMFFGTMLYVTIAGLASH